MASDIGILLNVGIILVLYLCMDRIQKLVFDGDSSTEEQDDRAETETEEAAPSRAQVCSQFRRGPRQFVAKRKHTPSRPTVTIRRGGIDIAIPSRGHLNVRTVSDVHRSDAHTRVLQRNLARGIDELFPSARDEIEAALRREAAGYRTWTPERVNSLAVRVVVRTLASKCCVLPSASATVQRSELAVLEDELHLQMGCVAKVLHLFPVTLTTFAARDLLPSNWRMYSNLSVAERLIAMVIDEERRGATPPTLPLIADSATPSGSQTSLVFKETLAITAAWTGNNPVEEVEEEEEEEDMDNSTALSSCLTLGGHRQTTTPLNDLMSSIREHPQTVESLRGEVGRALRDAVGFGSTSLNRLRNLESFLRESQRATHLFFSISG
ncbi:hypothetical protein N3K66_009038 [Trichothecium roseum]|uniref:Uncharacterized protein n=1 Tax=Trichothecium roseum TaxID=47278 RepID=A0ACC0UQ72_9HYPO|nr:hypothetical protein N3K66_009038 [Trichothecium roseum]